MTATPAPLPFALNGSSYLEVADGLAAGQTTVLWFAAYSFPDPTTVLVDALSQVSESDETNNSYSQTLPVPTPPPTCTPTSTPTATTTPTITPPPTGPHTFTAVADAYVKSGSSSNYGSDTELRLRDGAPDYDSYLKFDVAGVDSSVASAVLRLYTTGSGSDGGTVYAVANDWLEGEINSGNAPALSGTPLGSANGVAAGEWLEFDVTSVVTGNGTFSFGLSTSSSNSDYYSSREGTHPPQLVVSEGVPPTETPTATITPTPVETATYTPTPPPSGTHFFSALHDAYVKSTSPTTNYGADPQLRLRHGDPSDSDPDYDSYIQFQVAGVDSPVSNATLRLYTDSSGSDGADLYAVHSNWTGEDITWNNAPPLIGSPLDTATGVAQGQWLEFNVTAVVTGNGTYSFGLSKPAGGSDFYSSKNGSFAPQLVVTEGTAPTATPTATSTVTPSPTASPTMTPTPLGCTIYSPPDTVTYSEVDSNTFYTWLEMGSANAEILFFFDSQNQTWVWESTGGGHCGQEAIFIDYTISTLTSCTNAFNYPDGSTGQDMETYIAFLLDTEACQVSIQTPTPSPTPVSCADLPPDTLWYVEVDDYTLYTGLGMGSVNGEIHFSFDDLNEVWQWDETSLNPTSGAGYCGQEVRFIEYTLNTLNSCSDAFAYPPYSVGQDIENYVTFLIEDICSDTIFP